MDEKDLLKVNILNIVGTDFQKGKQMGCEFKKTVSYSELDTIQKWSSSVDSVMARAALNEVAPHLLEELAGFAEGMEWNLESVLKTFSGFDLELPPMGCTALVDHSGRYYRNYDFHHKLYDARIIVNHSEQHLTSIGFSQHRLGRLDGMNDKGLVVGLHFVNSERGGRGFLAPSIVRIILDLCSNVDEACEFLYRLPHKYCYNYSMTDASGKSIIVEAGPQGCNTITESPLACTNHFRSEGMRGWNRENIKGSMNRWHYANQLLEPSLQPGDMFQHFNQPTSPLFFKDYDHFFGTLHSVVYSPKEQTATISIGANHETKTISLQKVIKEHTLPFTEIEGVIEPGE